MAGMCHPEALTASFLLLSCFLFISAVNCLTFSDPDTAYAQYLPDWLPADRQSASFRFRSVRRDALLFLHHLTNRSSGEPVYNFWIELKAGKLQATNVFETFVETVTIGEGLDSDQWHTVEYTKDTAGLLRLNLDGEVKEIKLNSHRYGLAREKIGELSHNSVVTIGGLAPLSTEMAPREFSRLLGCMDRIKFLKMNGVLQEINVATTDGTEEGCTNKCFVDNQCQQGQCINQYYRTVCDCLGTGYEGQFCQKLGNMELTFQGHNYIQYQLNKIDQMVSRYRLRISLQFKVDQAHHSGVLFYAVGAVPVETYLAVFLQKGRVVIKAYFGSGETLVSRSESVLSDNSWHNIFIKHEGRFLVTRIDEQSNSHTISGDNYYFHFDPDMYIGGGPDPKGFAGLDVTANIGGCLKELFVDYENLVGAIKSNSTTTTFHGSDPLFECLELGNTPLTFPTKRSQLILNDWTSGTLNLKFTFRTSFPNGVLIHTLISIDNTPDGRLTVRLVNGTMELQVDLGTTGGTNRNKVVSVGTSLHNTAWHDLTLALRTGNILLTVDGRMVGIPHKHLISSRSAVYVGSDVSGANTGFEGCMRNIHIQDTELQPTEIINTDVSNGVTVDGCKITLNPCASGKLVCENGGACTHESNGTRCLCNSDAYTGSRCQFPIYKKSCEDYFRSGDRESGPKMIDMDGSGYLPAVFAMCDFTTGRPKTTIEHNFMPKTLIRSASSPSLDFTVQYRDMTPEMLAMLVKSSVQCRQLFSHWCYQAPLRLGTTSLIYAANNKSIIEYPKKFQRQCRQNKEQWRQDVGFLTDRTRLPITRMRFLKKQTEEFTRATLTLGQLECYGSGAASVPNTATFLLPESFITLRSWRSGTLSFFFRTSMVGTVIFHQTRGLKVSNSIIGIIAEENLFVFEVIMNDNPYNVSVETTRAMTDGEWHSVSIDIDSPDMLFTVDTGTALLSLPVDETIGQFRGMLRLGGSDQLPESTKGFTGCISAVFENGEDVFLYDYYNEFKTESIKPGCVSACASTPCQNGAKCLDMWSTYECICAHPAHQGKNCEIDNTKDVVSFSESAVHLVYTPSTTTILTDDINVSFRTYQTDALLLYANDHLHNFIQLELMDSAILVFKYNSGREIVEVMLDSQDDDGTSNSSEPVGSTLNNGSWVEVAVERKADKTILKVNDELMKELDRPVQLLTDYHHDPFNGAKETVMPPRLFVNSDKVDNFTLVLIGGAPEMMTSLPGLQGCMRGLMIGGKPLSLKMIATKTMKGVSTVCEDHCGQDICKHGGMCTELWSSFRCNCSATSYSGRYCNKDVGASFESTSLLMYPFTLYDDEPPESTEMDSLTFGFSTDISSGVLMYVRSDKEQDIDQSIIVQLVNGNVEASLDFGNGPTIINIEGTFNDGFRHVVVLKRYGNRVLFNVDNEDGNYTSLSDSTPVQFIQRAALVIGGVEYNMTRFGLEGSGGFEGCMAGLAYNRIRPLELLFGATAPSDKGGVDKAQCAKFKMSESSDTSESDVSSEQNYPDSSASLSKSSGSGMFVPWNVPAAVGQVYVEPTQPTSTMDPDLIKYIIIGVCALAIFILLLCIICMACRLNKRNKQEKKAALKHSPGRREVSDGFDNDPPKTNTYIGTPQKSNVSYQPVPQADPHPPPHHQRQLQPEPEQQPIPAQVQNESQVVATGHFTVEACPELNDQPFIPMIDDDVEDENTVVSQDMPPPVPTSPPPPLTPPQPKKSVSSETNGEQATTNKEKRSLVKTDSVLSDAETAV